MTDQPKTTRTMSPAASPAASSRETVWGMLCQKALEHPRVRLTSLKPWFVTEVPKLDLLLIPHHGTEAWHPFSNETAHQILRHGVSGLVLVPLGELLELSTAQLAPVLGVDRATARRYVQKDQQLPTHSAETVLRLAELEAMSMDVFESEESALGWLKTPHPLLDESPIDAAATSYGAQRVREILTAIKYGGVV